MHARVLPILSLGSTCAQEDNGFNVYTFQGEILQKHVFERLHAFCWRPRPASLLNTAQIDVCVCVCVCVSVLVLSVGHAVRFQSLRCQPPLTGNVQKIKKNLKTYQSEFEAQDVMQQSRTSDEQKKKRRDLLKLWEDYETSIAKATESRRARMAKMRAGTSLCPGFPLLPLVRWVVTRCACSWFVFFSLRSHACRCAASGPTEAGGARGACGAAHQGGHHHCRSRGLSAVVACFGVGCCCVGMICTEVTVSRMVR
jgi:hypothetical protein